jgi:drug/metabolite transporter (DMT)-like permease
VTRRGFWLFSAMGVLWGLPYLLIKVAVRDVSPATLVCGRTAIGALILVPIALSRGEMRPVLARWRPLVAYTVFELAIPWWLLTEAEKRLPSSLSGLLVAAVPLVGAVIAWRLALRGDANADRDRLGARGLGGLGLGLVGVGVLVGFDVSSADLGSVGLVGVVVVGYAIGPAILARCLGELPALGVVAWSLLLTTLGYAPFALTELPSRPPPAHALAAVAALGVLCTALAFVLFFALIGEVGPVRATVITYVNPAVAVILGVAFLHESFGTATALGFVLVLGGSYLSTSSARPGRRRLPAAVAGQGEVLGAGSAGDGDRRDRRP